MEIVPITITIRGHRMELEVPGADAPALEKLIADVEMLVLVAIALENPEADAVMRAFGLTLRQEQVVDGETVMVTIFPPEKS